MMRKGRGIVVTNVHNIQLIGCVKAVTRLRKAPGGVIIVRKANAITASMNVPATEVRLIFVTVVKPVIKIFGHANIVRKDRITIVVITALKSVRIVTKNTHALLTVLIIAQH